ncbi:MAG: cupin domain-containing protein [Gammaproteobacteria bacterium]|jgi:anti-sigma factor ChrR (cupin superfamily)
MLNMQFDQLVVVDTNEMEWQGSPSEGVWRKPLEREADEHGHTTSLVRYDAGSKFSSHSHPKGEEIFVLDGVFSDQTGDYPAGTYIRNPPGSSHSPFSKEGCELLVKLDQFDTEDVFSLRIDTGKGDWLPGEFGVRVMPLFYYQTEMVALYKWPAGTRYEPHPHFGGEEVFVISGTLYDEYGEYPAGTWIRSPHNSEHCPYTEEETLIWIKTGHLLP